MHFVFKSFFGLAIVLLIISEVVAKTQQPITASRKSPQYTITLLQGSAPISLDAHKNLLRVKQYSTDDADEQHNVQTVRVLENQIASFDSQDVNFSVRPNQVNQKLVQLEIVREFNDDATQQSLATTIRVPVGRWVEISGERSVLDPGQTVRSFSTEKGPAMHSHIYVKVERVQ